VWTCFGKKSCFLVGVFQVQDEKTKEEERSLACDSSQKMAEKRQSLWYAADHPTNERKVRWGKESAFYC
jgi:hypothetical protein